MIIPVIRELASKHSVQELEMAAQALETEQKNVLNVQGKDEGEILTNLLVAAEIREKVDAGMTLPEALREKSRSIQGLLKKRT